MDLRRQDCTCPHALSIVITPIEDAELQGKLREMLDVQLNNKRSVWEMDSDGHYTQRQPKNELEGVPAHEVLIDLAKKRLAKSPTARKKKKKAAKPRKKRKRN